MMSRKQSLLTWTFVALMAAHWLEHAFQAYQVYVMHMERACALGMLGMRYPWLVRTESLHFGFAILTTIGLLMLREVFVETIIEQDPPLSELAGSWGMVVFYEHDNPARRWWLAATYISFWHLFEHCLLFWQATAHHNLFGSSVPTSIIQQFVPRIELHLFYNTLVTIPIIVAMLLRWKYALQASPAELSAR